MILVFGAAGTCGAAVTRALAAVGQKVRGFVRDGVRGAVARDSGASEIEVGDLRDAASIERALDGVSGVFYVAPRFVADEAFIGRLVVDLSVRSGVRKFVFQSALHSGVRELFHHEFKREIEEALYASTLDFTILQPARMMHNIAPSLAKIAATGVFAEPFSADSPIADVDYEDVAEVAANAFTQPGFGGATLELCSEVLNRHQRAAILSEVLGRPVAPGTITVDSSLAAAGIRDPYERAARMRMFDYYNRSGFRASDLVLRGVLGRPPSSYRAFLVRATAGLRVAANP